MEVVGVKKIFGRLLEKHNARYNEYLGDGELSLHSIENIYENMNVVKKECVGHIQKRVHYNVCWAAR